MTETTQVSVEHIKKVFKTWNDGIQKHYAFRVVKGEVEETEGLLLTAKREKELMKRIYDDLLKDA